MERFRNDEAVTIFQGDSGEIMGEVIKDIDNPIIFWLDGHYSAGITSKGSLHTPILREKCNVNASEIPCSLSATHCVLR